MLSYKGDVNLKNSLIRRVEAHAKADRIVKGHYWQDGKGCALGCMTEVDSGTHGVLQDRYNIPVWLGRVIDRVFEGMLNEDAMKFPLQVSEAIPVGVDLEQVKTPFLIFVLESTLDNFDHAKFPDVKEAIDRVIELYKSGETDLSLFREARAYAAADADAYADADADTADAAAYAADAAADAAAYAADAAADAAAAYAAAYAAYADAYAAADAAADAAAYADAAAAYAAAYAAYADAYADADAAAAAADAAAYAAYAYADAYADAADAYADAARSNAYKKFADKLLELLRECK